MKTPEPIRWVRASEAAKRLGVSQFTVDLWCLNGQLKAWRFHDTGRWRVDVESIEKIERDRRESYTIKQAAALLNCHWDTIRMLMQRGYLKAYRLPPNREWRISKAALDRYLQERTAEAMPDGDT
jgi:excisionase family DNA binding protein